MTDHILSEDCPCKPKVISVEAKTRTHKWIDDLLGPGAAERMSKRVIRAI